MQRERLGRRGAVVGRDFGDGLRRGRAIGFEQFLGLPLKLIEVGVLAHGASRRFLTHMSSFPGRALWARAVVARRPLCRARKEFISRTTWTHDSGWTPSFPRTWVAPRAPI